MTTVAWDGRTLAGDTQCTAGGLPFSGVKIWRLSNGRLFGASGDAEDCEAVRMWLEHEEGKKPEVKSFAAILVTTDGRCHRFEDKLIGFEVTSPFHAVGSGRDFAIMAMHLGKTAREAVDLSSLYDIYTGGPISTLELRPNLSLATK